MLHINKLLSICSLSRPRSFPALCRHNPKLSTLFPPPTSHLTSCPLPGFSIALHTSLTFLKSRSRKASPQSLRPERAQPTARRPTWWTSMAISCPASARRYSALPRSLALLQPPPSAHKLLCSRVTHCVAGSGRLPGGRAGRRRVVGLQAHGLRLTRPGPARLTTAGGPIFRIHRPSRAVRNRGSGLI
jgi:hypothetical protein